MKKTLLIIIPIIFIFIILGVVYFDHRQTESLINNLPQEAINPSGGDNNMKIESPAFANDQMIPSKYTCDSDNVSPPLEISGYPSAPGVWF